MKKWLLLITVLAVLGLSGCASEEPWLEPIFATVEIQIPCTDPLHIQPPQESTGEGPFLMADPQCGTFAEAFDVQGTEIALSGSGFYPNTETTLIWDDSSGYEFRQRQDGEYVTPVTDQGGDFTFSLIMPYKVPLPNISEDYVVWELTAFQGEPVEEVIPLQWDLVIEHFYIAIAGGIIGIGTGIALAYLLVKALQWMIQTRPSLRAVGFFLPWRTLLVSLLMHLIYPIVLIIQFGVTAKTGAISVSAANFLMTIFICSTLLLWKWQSFSLATQVRSAIRTLAVLSVFFTSWISFFGIGGVTYTISMHIRLYEYGVARRYYFLLVGMVAIVDLLGGGIAFLMDRREENALAVSESEG